MDPLEVASYKLWWLRAYSLPGTPQGEGMTCAAVSNNKIMVMFSPCCLRVEMVNIC